MMSIRPLTAEEKLDALELINTGTADYMAARCTLLNGLFSGLQLACQAVEKTMKGILKLSNPDIKWPKGAKGHDLIALNDLIIKHTSIPGMPDRSQLNRLMEHYERRYPDAVRGRNWFASSRIELDALDFTMRWLMLVTPDIPEKWKIGVAAQLTPLAFGVKSGIDKWIWEENYSLGPIMEDIFSNIRKAHS